MEQQTARLRKAFRYPADEDENSEPEAMDEEEQSKLISHLHTLNASQNKTHTTILLSLPTLSSLLYLRPLFQLSTTLLSLLAFTSLGISAWTLYALPPHRTGLSLIDGFIRRSASASKVNTSKKPDDKDDFGAPTYGGYGLNTPSQQSSSSSVPFALGQRIDKSPLELYLPILNLCVISILFLGGLLLKTGVEGGVWKGFGVLPGGVYAVVVVSKWIMGDVDVGELEGLRYGFKGA